MLFLVLQAALQEPRTSAQGTVHGATTDPEQVAAPTTETSPLSNDPATFGKLFLLPIAGYGVDPVVLQVTEQIVRNVATETRHLTYAPEDIRRTVQALRIGQWVSPQDLESIRIAVGANAVMFIKIWPAGETYTVECLLVKEPGMAQSVVRIQAKAETFESEVKDGLLTLIPTHTGQAWATPSNTPAHPTSHQPSNPLGQHAPGTAALQLSNPSLDPNNINHIRRRSAEYHPFALTLQTEAVFGFTEKTNFYSHIAGLRFDWKLSPQFGFGATVSYINLEGRYQRVSNLLFMINVEYRILFGRLQLTDLKLPVSIPLRVAVGYLPNNGPVLRVSAGINIPLSANWEIGTDILVPTFWFIPNQTHVSLDLSLELIYKWGG